LLSRLAAQQGKQLLSDLTVKFGAERRFFLSPSAFPSGGCKRASQIRSLTWISPGQLPEALVLFNLRTRLLNGTTQRDSLGDGFPVHFAGQYPIRSVTQSSTFGAMAVRLATFTVALDQRTRSHVDNLSDPRFQALALGQQWLYLSVIRGQEQSSYL
jgi:hypothetical protein